VAKKAKWIDQGIVVTKVFLGLCTTERQFLREMRKLCVSPNAEWAPDNGARTHFLVNKKNMICCLVCLNPAKGKSIEAYALLVHEISHVWDHIAADLDERNPSSEFKAYGMQQLFLNYADAYKKLKKRGK